MIQAEVQYRRDNVGLLVSPLKEKIIDGKIKVLLCNDIVDSVHLLKELLNV